MLQCVERPTHGENRKGLLLTLLYPSGVIEQGSPPFLQYVPQGTPQFVSINRIKQRMGAGSRNHHAILANDMALDHCASLIREVKTVLLNKRVRRMIRGPVVEHPLGNITPIELP